MKENIINYIPLKVYRYLRWKVAQDKTYRKISDCYGNEYAKLCYDAEKAIHFNYPIEITLDLLKRKDDYILSHIETKCKNIIDSAKEYQPAKNNSNEFEKAIWVFWWTGKSNAPEIVKACIKSIRRNSNGHKVIVIDKDNIDNYVTFPDYINEKHKQGKIGHAHYSDIVRMSLLSKYGGVWIDATVFISQPLPDELFTAEFYTAKSVDDKSFYFSHSRWVGYFLAGNKDFPLFSFVKDMMLEYWKSTDEIIDYLFMDYLFDIAYRHIPYVKTVMDDIPDNNLARGELMSKINAPYSKELFEKLMNGNTFLSKLSWRYGNPVPLTASGKKTNYGYLIEL